MKTVYIAGPMTGLPELNYPAFKNTAMNLRAMGYAVENPADNPAPPCGSWLGYMRLSLAQIAKVDGLVMLPGWEKSRGARLEFQTATALGLDVLTLDEALNGQSK